MAIEIGLRFSKADSQIVQLDLLRVAFLFFYLLLSSVFIFYFHTRQGQHTYTGFLKNGLSLVPLGPKCYSIQSEHVNKQTYIHHLMTKINIKLDVLLFFVVLPCLGNMKLIWNKNIQETFQCCYIFFNMFHGRYIFLCTRYLRKKYGVADN